MADDAFVAIPYSELTTEQKNLMETNAAGYSVFNQETKSYYTPTAEEYYNLRGGTNQSGYYGDSYVQGLTLTDAEYQAALDAAKASGASGTALGSAINAASSAKRLEFMKQMGFTNQDQLNAYLNGTSELYERMRRREDLAEQRSLGISNTPTYLTTNPILSPIPPTPISSQISPPPPPVKTAPIDTILYEEDPVPVEIMADLIFENIGGQELINISRNDLVNGQKVIYQPIKNLNNIQQEYNPNNIIALQNISPQIFNSFPIKLDSKVPTLGSGPGGAFIYIDPTNGDLVVEAINIEKDEQIEIQIIQGGTIYEEEL